MIHNLTYKDFSFLWEIDSLIEEGDNIFYFKMGMYIPHGIYIP